MTKIVYSPSYGSPFVADESVDVASIVATDPDLIEFVEMISEREDTSGPYETSDYIEDPADARQLEIIVNGIEERLQENTNITEDRLGIILDRIVDQASRGDLKVHRISGHQIVRIDHHDGKEKIIHRGGTGYVVPFADAITTN